MEKTKKGLVELINKTKTKMNNFIISQDEPETILDVDEDVLKELERLDRYYPIVTILMYVGLTISIIVLVIRNWY